MMERKKRQKQEKLPTPPTKIGRVSAPALEMVSELKVAALGLQNSNLGIRNSIPGMASHNLSNTIPAILGATPVSECTHHVTSILGMASHDSSKTNAAILGAYTATLLSRRRSLSRRRLPCGISLERAGRIDASSANCRAKSRAQVRPSERKPIFRCPPLRCPPNCLILVLALLEREKDREREGRRREKRGPTQAERGERRKKDMSSHGAPACAGTGCPVSCPQAQRSRERAPGPAPRRGGGERRGGRERDGPRKHRNPNKNPTARYGKKPPQKDKVGKKKLVFLGEKRHKHTLNRSKTVAKHLGPKHKNITNPWKN